MLACVWLCLGSLCECDRRPGEGNKLLRSVTGSSTGTESGEDNEREHESLLTLVLWMWEMIKGESLPLDERAYSNSRGNMHVCVWGGGVINVCNNIKPLSTTPGLWVFSNIFISGRYLGHVRIRVGIIFVCLCMFWELLKNEAAERSKKDNRSCSAL